MLVAIHRAINVAAGALNNEIVVLISWGSCLVKRDVIEQRAPMGAPTGEIIADEATSNKQRARIFRTVGE